jgi:tetratricopeptide (TPR) repeat protein
MFLAASQPARAIRAFEAASRLKPSDPFPYVEAGILWEKQGDLAEAEKAFRAAVKLGPDSAEAYAGLANVYTRSKQLQGAAAALRQFVRLRPNDVNAHLQLGRILRELGYTVQARAEFETAETLSPADTAVLRELAATDVAEGHLAQAHEEYGRLVKLDPNDPELRYAFGSVLLKQKSFAEAEEQLLAAVGLKRDLADAYSELAVAAAENKHYELALRALDQRARYLAESPGTYFLRATSYDNLKAYPQAADFYHRFLAVAGGKYPDQEWQARHRLIAIEPKGKKKKN